MLSILKLIFCLQVYFRLISVPSNSMGFLLFLFRDFVSHYIACFFIVNTVKIGHPDNGHPVLQDQEVLTIFYVANMTKKRARLFGHTLFYIQCGSYPLRTLVCSLMKRLQYFSGAFKVCQCAFSKYNGHF